MGVKTLKAHLCQFITQKPKPTFLAAVVVCLFSYFTVANSMIQTTEIPLTLPSVVEMPSPEITFKPKPLKRVRIPTSAKTDYDAERECLAQNIYFESRDQPLTGQVAVGLVTLNRTTSNRWPNTICGVVKQRKQFSWFWDGKSDRPRNKVAYAIAENIASTLLSPENAVVDLTDGATHYHATYVAPKWKGSLTKVTQIGGHVFYR